MSILMNAQHLRKIRQRAENVRSKNQAQQTQKSRLEKEKEKEKNHNKMEKNWTFHMEGVVFNILFHKTSLAVSCNGIAIPAAHEFHDEGAVITFTLNDHVAQVKTSSHAKEGIVFTMTIDGQYVPSTDDY
ncbi:fas apoptotic inhibitory molecule 1-like [Haliotis cracherodii]|uniref:fas apoptotic inhibitory molecule 1-like n=1 Tax=Haliotis cracherodii TaxID=6455 RepID=UPI0039EAC034